MPPSHDLLTGEMRAFLRDVPAAPFCPLTPEAVLAATGDLWTRAPLAEAMGLVVLNDTDDSNHYCLVTRGPATGAVVFVPHDDSATLAFPSLHALHEAMVRAAAEGAEIWDIEPASPVPHGDQAPLRSHLRALLTGDRADAPNVVGMLLPLLDPEDIETLRLAATDPDFLIRESAAGFMARVPRPSQVPLLSVLATDRYPQVQRPARTALDALGHGP